ncbi:MAG: hypothetical protein ABL986_16320 [Vicinamibacterales bacterium]
MRLSAPIVVAAIAAAVSLAIPTHARAQGEELRVRREAVLSVLRTPERGTMAEIARVRGAALGALAFDALPIAHQFIADEALGTDAAYAMLGADETRALSLIFESIPQSGPNIQRIAYTWFLDRYAALADTTKAAARGAALRTLEPVRSTANAEAALYVIGLTGSRADLPVLEFHAVNFRTGSRGMRDASHAALLRIGSPAHLDRILLELARPLEPTATYQQGVALTLALQKAGFSGRTELVPAICGHLGDMPLREIDIHVDTGRSARLALNAIVDGVSVTHLSSGVRSAEDWTMYCADASRR